MKYYNPTYKIIACSDELISKGVNISNQFVMNALDWYDLHDENNYIYDNNICKLVRVGNPVFNTDNKYYIQHYKVISLPTTERDYRLELVKKNLFNAIDVYTDNEIQQGFDAIMPIDGIDTLLHFSYDQTDQNNFSDAANLSMISLNIDIGITTVDWNGYKDYTKDTGGKLVVLTLGAIEFLQLHSNALQHRATYSFLNKEMKMLVSSAITIEDLQTKMSNYGMEIDYVL